MNVNYSRPATTRRRARKTNTAGLFIALPVIILIAVLAAQFR